jgi:hypothetical protein
LARVSSVAVFWNYRYSELIGKHDRQQGKTPAPDVRLQGLPSR